MIQANWINFLKKTLKMENGSVQSAMISPTKLWRAPETTWKLNISLTPSYTRVQCVLILSILRKVCTIILLLDINKSYSEFKVCQFFSSLLWNYFCRCISESSKWSESVLGKKFWRWEISLHSVHWLQPSRNHPGQKSCGVQTLPSNVCVQLWPLPRDVQHQT